MTGMIQGGWEYVWASYAVTLAALLGYGASLAVRLRAAQRCAAALPAHAPRTDSSGSPR